jgi:hypothetical protein
LPQATIEGDDEDYTNRGKEIKSCRDFVSDMIKIKKLMMNWMGQIEHENRNPCKV